MPFPWLQKLEAANNRSIFFFSLFAWPSGYLPLLCSVFIGDSLCLQKLLKPAK
jgi:hypothetical protein